MSQECPRSVQECLRTDNLWPWHLKSAMAPPQFNPKAMVDFDSLWPRGLFPDERKESVGNDHSQWRDHSSHTTKTREKRRIDRDIRRDSWVSWLCSIQRRWSYGVETKWTDWGTIYNVCEYLYCREQGIWKIRYHGDKVLMEKAVSCLMEGNKGKNKVTDGRSRCGNRGDFCFYLLIWTALTPGFCDDGAMVK